MERLAPIWSTRIYRFRFETWAKMAPFEKILQALFQDSNTSNEDQRLIQATRLWHSHPNCWTENLANSPHIGSIRNRYERALFQLNLWHIIRYRLFHSDNSSKDQWRHQDTRLWSFLFKLSNSDSCSITRNEERCTTKVWFWPPSIYPRHQSHYCSATPAPQLLPQLQFSAPKTLPTNLAFSFRQMKRWKKWKETRNSAGWGHSQVDPPQAA